MTDPKKFDPGMPRDSGNFSKGKNWKEYYPNDQDELPPNMTDPLGPPVQIACFLNADHAGDHLTGVSYSGILIYVNRALVRWYSKRQKTVEASSFGSEVICGRIACENFEALT